MSNPNPNDNPAPAPTPAPGAVGAPGQPPAAPVPPPPPGTPATGTASRAPQEGVPNVGLTTSVNPAAGEPDRPETRGIAGGTAGTHPEHRDAQGRLTRRGMEAVHGERGSVLYQGRIIPPGHPLPSEAELTGGEPRAVEAARRNLAERRAAIDAEEARLNAMQPGGTGTTETAQRTAEAGRRRGEPPEGGASGTQGGNAPTAQAAAARNTGNRGGGGGR